MQEPAKAFVTLDDGIRARLRFLRKYQHVSFALVIPFLVIVRDVILQSGAPPFLRPPSRRHLLLPQKWHILRKVEKRNP